MRASQTLEHSRPRLFDVVPTRRPPNACPVPIALERRRPRVPRCERMTAPRSSSWLAAPPTQTLVRPRQSGSRIFLHELTASWFASRREVVDRIVTASETHDRSFWLQALLASRLSVETSKNDPFPTPWLSRPRRPGETARTHDRPVCTSEPGGFGPPLLVVALQESPCARAAIIALNVAMAFAGAMRQRTNDPRYWTTRSRNLSISPSAAYHPFAAHSRRGPALLLVAGSASHQRLGCLMAR